MTTREEYGISGRDLNALCRLMDDEPDLDVMDALVEIGIETGYLQRSQIKALHRDYGRHYGNTES